MWLLRFVVLCVWWLFRLTSCVQTCRQSPSSAKDRLICSVQQFSLVNIPTVNYDSLRYLSVQCEDDSSVQSKFDATPLSAIAPSLEKLDVERCKFSSLPSGFLRSFNNLRELRIRTNNVEWSSVPLAINDGSFDDLSNLAKLDLSGNGLRDLNSDAFSGISSLKVLNLTDNRLRDFYRLSRITSSVNLEVIDVSDNSYSSVPSSAFAGHSRLRKLIMKRNRLLEVEELGLRNLPELEAVDLSENMLDALPAMMLSESVRLQELLLQQNNISILPPGLFSELPSLTSLNISHNQLSSQWVKRNTFSGLLHLIVLDLSSNRLDDLSEFMFRDLHQLQVLRLDHNNIHTLPPFIFAQLRNLHTLSMAGNQLTVVDAGVFDSLQVLNSLVLSDNSLKVVHESSFVSLFNVENLKLDGNGLDSFPAALVNLTQLRNLDVSNNNIGRISGDHIGQMRHLSVFRAAGNQLSEITADLAHILSSLSMLDLSNNRLEKIHSGAFGSHSRLRAVRLDANRLKNINGIFNNMSSLLWLNASDNAIEFFDYALFPSQLLWLDLHQNRIKIVGNFYSIHDKISLETLDLSFNEIEQIDSTSVPDSIKYFIISSNRLSQVKPGTLLQKTQLVRLDLSSNELSQLSLQAITTNISAANGTETEQNPNSDPRAHLLIGGNPFVCDCTMDWLVNINSMTPSRMFPKLLDAGQVMCRFKGDHQPKHLLHASASDFLCTYDRHCFALCHCCNYVACDCEMRCPDPCTCHHDHTWSSNIVDCRSRQLEAVSRSIPMDATRLLVDGNQISQLHSHTFIGRQRLELLQVNASGVEHIQNRSLSGLTALRILRLQDNRLSRLRGDEFTGLLSLEELYLHNNVLTHVQPDTFTGLRALKVLTLHGNQLVNFEVWKLSTNPYLVELTLAGNPWSCNCGFLAKMTRYVRENRAKIDDNRSLQCAYQEKPPRCGDSMNGGVEHINGAAPGNEDGFIQRRDANKALPVILVSAGAVTAALLLTVCLVYRCRAQICSKQRLLHPTKTDPRAPTTVGGAPSLNDKKPTHLHVSATPPVDQRLYDVFVTYSAQDTHFVNDMLTPMLESTEPSLRLCLLRRDAPPANYLGDAVRHCVQASAKTLLVLSRNFLDSEWCRFDFKASHIDALRCTRNVVAILYGIERSTIEEELKTLLKGAAVITFGERDFWRKLRSVLPPGRSRTLPSGQAHMTRVLFPSVASSTQIDESPSPTCSTVVSEDRCLSGANHFRSLSHPQRLRVGAGGSVYGRTVCSVSASMSEPSDHVYMTIDQYRTPPPPPPPSLPPGHPAAVYSTLEPDSLVEYPIERPLYGPDPTYCPDYAPDRGLRTSGRTGPINHNADHILYNTRRPTPLTGEGVHRSSPSQSLWV